MLIYEALEKDHQKLKALVEDLVEVSERNERRKAKLLVEEIRDELIPHSRAEEAVFYNILGTFGEAQPLVLHHGFQEHIEAEAILRSLQAKEDLDKEWHLLVRKFQKALLEHIDEEENEIFETAKKFLSETDATMMAATFEQLKPQVLKEGWVKNTLDLVVNLMPPRYAATLRTLALKPESNTLRSHH